MRVARFRAILVWWLPIALTPASAAAASASASVSAYCAEGSATVYNFEHSLSPDWQIYERPMRTPAAPYPDGSTDGDIGANVQAGGGVLHLMARRAENGFTGSRLLSRAVIRYGCIEIVARLPHGRGFWPALWLRTPYDGSPINGEIDIVEGFGSHPGVFMSTLHHWHNGIDANGALSESSAGVRRPEDCAKVVADIPRSDIATRLLLAKAKMAGTERGRLGNWLFAYYENVCRLHVLETNADFSRDFHKYTVVWTPDRVIWALDDRTFFTTGDRVPQAAMMIVMCLSVGSLDGGVNAGTPDEGDFQIKSVRSMKLR